MVARAALGRALVASAGTMLALGGATFVVSSISMGVARAVLDQRKKDLAVPCHACGGKQKLVCDVCAGDKVVRYHPFKDLPLGGGRAPHAACAMCSATGQQTCTNCLGEGRVLPFTGPGAELLQLPTITITAASSAATS